MYGLGIVTAKDPLPPPKKKTPNLTTLVNVLPLFCLGSLIAFSLAITVLYGFFYGAYVCIFICYICVILLCW